MRPTLPERDKRFARAQYRRRMQASGMIGVMGAAIGIWPLRAAAAVADGACTWRCCSRHVPGSWCWRLLDVWATRQHFHRLRSEQLATQLQLALELASREIGRRERSAKREGSHDAVDPFRLAIALVPLAAYVLLLGLVNLRRRPFLTRAAAI